MSLKEMGRSKPVKIIKCPNCKKKLFVDEMIENGNMEKLAGVTICSCQYCDEQWNEK